MELNWSTFLFEIVNFLILVWILKRFLYHPILEAIARRREAIEEQMAKADRLRSESQELKQRYENRLSDWEKERQKAMDKLMHELEDTRHLQLENLKSELAREEEKIQVVRSRQEKQFVREVEQRALQQSAQFASKLLGQATGKELEDQLLEVLLENLAAFPDDQLSMFSEKWGETPESIQVSSAFPVADDKRQLLEYALHGITGLTIPLRYDEDPSLLAGFNITIGAWVLQLSVRDELQGFLEVVQLES